MHYSILAQSHSQKNQRLEIEPFLSGFLPFFLYKNGDLQSSISSTQTEEMVDKAFMSLKLDSLEEKRPPCIGVYDDITPGIIMGSSSPIDDYIGAESCFDLGDHEEIFTSPSKKGVDGGQRCCSRNISKQDQKCSMRKKKFPPPIPLLARTENLPCRMPWVLKRHYTGDGRLILTEERVRHHEYFRAHRFNGRLILQLVPLDDDLLAPPFINGDDNLNEAEPYNNTIAEAAEEREREREQEGRVEGDEDTEGMNNIENGDDVESNNGVDDVEEKSETMEEELVLDAGGQNQTVPAMETSRIARTGSSPAVKCFNYSSVRSSSTRIFGVTVLAMRPVPG